MEKVEGARVERQLLEHVQVEVGLAHELRRRLAQDVDRGGHEPAVAAVGGAGAGHPHRHRPDALVPIRLRQPAVLQHRHRPPADVVVEPLDRLVHDGLRIVPRTAHREHGLSGAHQEEGPLDRPRRLMLEKVAVKPAVGGEQPVEDDVEHRPRLARVAKRRIDRLQVPQPVDEQRGRGSRGVRGFAAGPHRRRRLEIRIQLAQRPPGVRIERTGREVEVPEDDRGRTSRGGTHGGWGHGGREPGA